MKRGRSCLTTTASAQPATPCCDVAVAAAAHASSGGVPAADACSDAAAALCAAAAPAADTAAGVAVNAETSDVSEFGEIEDAEPLTVVEGAGEAVP